MDRRTVGDLPSACTVKMRVRVCVCGESWIASTQRTATLLLIDCGDDLAVEVQERAKGKKTVSRVGSRHQVRKSAIVFPLIAFFSTRGDGIGKCKSKRVGGMKTYIFREREKKKIKLCFLR